MNAPHALAGRRILITRAAEDAERWAERLRSLGAAPTVFPCLQCEPINDLHTAGVLRAALNGNSWLVLTSARGAQFAAQLLQAPLDACVSIAAVGAATAEAATERFGRIDFVARTGTARGLARELIAQWRAEGTVSRVRVAIATADGGRDDAEREFDIAGITVTRVNVYRTIPAPPSPEPLQLGAGEVDDVWLASPSAVTGLLNRAVMSPSVRVTTIGPTTTAAATAAGLRVSAEAPQPTLEGMLAVAL